MTEREAYIAFNLADGIGSVKVAELVTRCGTVAKAWEAWPRKIARAGGEVDLAAELRRAKAFEIDIVTPADAEYPRILLETPAHPLALYVKGDVKALARPALSIVGTRRATEYGRSMAEDMGHDLASAGWAVVSGLALGIDACAHRGALAAGGVTVGVIGSALDRFYPTENRELAREMAANGGAVVSEFPFGRECDEQTFPQRNRIVAALSRGVIAVEAPARSGTLITTSIAADLGRTVMAVPGKVDSRSSAGCLKLIRDGAILVRGAEDVLDEMSELMPRSKIEGAVRPVLPEAPPQVTLEESLVLKEIDQDGKSIDRIVSATGLEPAKVAAICMGLRLKGVLRYLPGNRVALPRR